MSNVANNYNYTQSNPSQLFEPWVSLFIYFIYLFKWFLLEYSTKPI